MPDIRCWIIGSREPVEADPARVTQTRTDEEINDLLAARGLDVAPGVRIALLGTGDHLHYGKVIWGALIAVRTNCLCPPRLLASGGAWPLCPVHGDRPGNGTQEW